MTQDEIIRMAREAGISPVFPFVYQATKEELERFAALVAAHTLEKDADLTIAYMKGVSDGAAHEREKEIKRVAEGHGWTQAHWTAYEESIATAEREACAKVCEEYEGTLHQWTNKGKAFATAIRARNNNAC